MEGIHQGGGPGARWSRWRVGGLPPLTDVVGGRGPLEERRPGAVVVPRAPPPGPRGELRAGGRSAPPAPVHREGAWLRRRRPAVLQAPAGEAVGNGGGPGMHQGRHGGGRARRPGESTPRAAGRGRGASGRHPRADVRARAQRVDATGRAAPAAARQPADAAGSPAARAHRAEGRGRAGAGPPRLPRRVTVTPGVGGGGAGPRPLPGGVALGADAGGAGGRGAVQVGRLRPPRAHGVIGGHARRVAARRRQRGQPLGRERPRLAGRHVQRQPGRQAARGVACAPGADGVAVAPRPRGAVVAGLGRSAGPPLAPRAPWLRTPRMVTGSARRAGRWRLAQDREGGAHHRRPSAVGPRGPAQRRSMPKVQSKFI
jgi:hypothetical protein